MCSDVSVRNSALLIRLLDLITLCFVFFPTTQTHIDYY